MDETPGVWQVIVHRDPEKVLRKLPKNLVRRIWERLRELRTNPYPSDCKKLAGYDNLYRLRVGDWRISYAVEENRLIVLVLEISPRGGAYRNL
jgi:mRNA interferase RelE/StbE